MPVQSSRIVQRSASFPLGSNNHNRNSTNNKHITEMAYLTHNAYVTPITSPHSGDALTKNTQHGLNPRQ